jgi:hydrogenase maturation protein HypF
LSLVPSRRKRLRIVCLGVVQGVGFRPCVHRLATSLGLGGFVLNGPEGVVVEVEGEDGEPEVFIRALPSALPPLARLDETLCTEVSILGETAFLISESLSGPRRRALVPPDSALCGDCRREMETPSDRRYRYPFTTCTNCGPRFSLVHALPYDRERTAMSCFPLCSACRKEYEDPGDRRFHAEPVCCPQCGPVLWLSGPLGETIGEGSGAIRGAQNMLAGGMIVAIKALGGFQLACRADDPGAVTRLRDRKRRPTKPFALMARDLEAARRLVVLSAEDETLMMGPRAPVILAPVRAAAQAPRLVGLDVAPGMEDLGVMLPTAPLHVECFRDAPYDHLVMTSGNMSDEPICKGNREALERLAGLADGFLLHDRDVVRRVDDSVARSGPHGPFLIRRARGYTPEALPLPVESPDPVLALGGFLQATACLAVEGEAFLSQHVGDLDGEPARGFLREVAEGLEDFLQAQGGVIVVDEHPDYPSTTLGESMARRRGAKLLRVQHHLAHAAAAVAEHGAFPAPGEWAGALILDGTGWGPDGTAWGGEWLILNGDLAWRRVAFLEPLPLVGGEAAVREPWRVAAAALALCGETPMLSRLPMASKVNEERLAAVARLAMQGSWPRASGAGRLFEAAGALLGLAVVNGWEGEAAARLEALAAPEGQVKPWPEAGACLGGAGLKGGLLLCHLARRVLEGEPPALAAAGFHATFCRMALEVSVRSFDRTIHNLGLGGGCLVNRILREGLGSGLRALGYNPCLPRLVPPGDGGLSYGQAVLGAVAEERATQPRFLGS